MEAEYQIENILCAVEENNIEAIQYALKSEINVNTHYHQCDDYSLLGYVILTCCDDSDDPNDNRYSDEMLELLIEYCPDVNYKHNGLSYLMLALKHDNFEAAKILIKRGADVNVPDAYGTTPLIYCLENYISTSYYDMIEFLLDAGADHQALNDNGMSCLMLAAEIGDSDCVTMFLNTNRGGGVNDVDNYNNTALHYATKCRPYFKKDFVKDHEDQLDQVGKTIYSLLYAGANVNIINDEGKTPLFNAVEMKNVAAVELLLPYGADPYLEDYDGNTCIGHMCKIYDDNQETIDDAFVIICQLLVDHSQVLFTTDIKALVDLAIIVGTVEQVHQTAIFKLVLQYNKNFAIECIVHVAESVGNDKIIRTIGGLCPEVDQMDFFD